MSLKPFNKLAVRALSSLKHEVQPSVLNLIKHSCSFIKHYITSVAKCRGSRVATTSRGSRVWVVGAGAGAGKTNS